MMIDIYEEIVKIRKAGEKSALATVISSKGSSPRRPGAKMIIKNDGSVIGTIGGGAIEEKVIESAKEVIRTSQIKVIDYNLSDIGMLCGGQTQVLIEPISIPNKLYIFGGGHVGLSLASIAYLLGFNTIIIDSRPEIATQERFPNATEIYCGDYIQIINEKLNFDENSYITIITPSHETDRDILLACLKKGNYKYIGMIGSKKKVMQIFEYVKNEGISDEKIKSVHSPIGLGINAETPEEIAVSIIGEIISVKNEEVKKHQIVNK